MSALSQQFKRFAHHHDEMPAFHAGYLVITFLFAAMFNLGVFAILMIAHMSLDYVKYREVQGFSVAKTFQGIFFESLIDLMLFAIALVFGVYLHHFTGLIAISGLLRAEQTIIRTLGMIIPKLDIIHHLYVDFFDMKNHMNSIPEELMKGWTLTDKICMAFMIIGFGLVALAPQILGLSSDTYIKILSDLLVPWNF